MSAIWGTISLTNQLPLNTDDLMANHYKENCKIDRFESISHPHVYFGCGIQYITKEAESERLPFYHTKEHFYLTADCILDNRDELFQALNESDTTIPDGSLICLAYQKWGIDCVKHLRGLFSFAIYEPEKNTLYLAADHTSSRCLYYYCTSDSITFSTLLTPLRRLHPEIVVNEYYIKDFLTAPGLLPNVVPDETPLQNVYKLNPGSYQKITWNNSTSPTPTEHSYWTPGMDKPTHKYLTATKYGKAFRTLYEHCVTDALRTQGNIGISMSGGLDSSSIGALAATQLRKTNQSLYTYTYVPFEKSDCTTPDKVNDETDDVQKIAALHPNMIPHFLNTHGRNSFDHIPKGIKVMEIPYKAFGNLPSLFEIYENASADQCKVVLTGQLGNITVSHGYINDVLFDLYTRKKYYSLTSYLRQHCNALNLDKKNALKRSFQRFKYANTVYQKTGFHYQPSNPFLSDYVTECYPMEQRYSSVPFLYSDNLPVATDLYHKIIYWRALLTYLGELDTKAGLAHGIILRDPTRDSRILDFCYHLPYQLFAYKGTPRWLIRSQLRDVLPHGLLDAWTRRGVQNSDFMQRLDRDWLKILPALEQAINHQDLESYIDTNQIKSFLATRSSAPSSEQRMETIHLLTIYCLYQFFLQLC